MKVITTYLKPRYASLANAIRGVSDSFGIWQNDVYPVFDFFYYNKPDLILVDEAVMSESFIEATKDLDAKIIYFGSNVPEGLNPDVVCAEPRISSMMRKHLQEQCDSVLYLKDCVDIETDIGGEFDENLACDIGVQFPDGGIGNVENLKLIVHLSERFNSVKVVGNDSISVPCFVGSLSNKRSLDFMKSSKIFVDIDASNLLRCAANAQFCVSTIDNSLFPSITLTSAEEVISSLLENKEDMKGFAVHAKNSVLEEGTNMHNAIKVFIELDMPDVVSKLSNKLAETL